MFTINDICDIAIQIERNGETVYRQAAENITDTKTADLLKELADDEVRHAKWFENLHLERSEPFGNVQLENAGRELLQGMMENQTFSLDAAGLVNAQTIEGILAQSISFETDTILFYEMLGGFIEEKNVLRQLENIIREERSHVEKLKGLLPQGA